MKTTFQKIKKEKKDKFAIAEQYYAILSVLNDLKLTEREIQLVAFAAVRGNMSYANVRQDFCEKFHTSSPTINNMISRMKKLHLMIKEGGKVKVNPHIILPFDENIVLTISLQHEQTEG